MNDEEIKNKAILLLVEIKQALFRGTKHYRKSDGKLLETPKEILEALLEEKEIEFVPGLASYMTNPNLN